MEFPLVRQVSASIYTILHGKERFISLTAIALLLLALAGTFDLPWHVPVSFALSNSYEVGFNNLIAQSSFPVAVFALAVCLARFAPRIFASDAIDAIRLSGMALSRGDFLAIGASLLLQYGFILFLWWIPASYFADGSYFVNRAEAWFQGSRPYWDVEYSHGIIFLAPVVSVQSTMCIWQSGQR